MLRAVLVLFAAAVFALGPGELVQVVAWGGMLIERAPRQGLAAASRSTFGGEQPCGLCRVAAVVRDQDPERPALVVDLRLDWPIQLAQGPDLRLPERPALGQLPPLPCRLVPAAAGPAPPRGVPR